MERKKEILNKSLSYFINNGIVNASMNNLAKELNIPKSVIYYYFESKDELVVECAKQAKAILEEKVLYEALKGIDDPDNLYLFIKERADQYAELMKFFTAISISVYYRDFIKSEIRNFADHYESFAQRAATLIGCDVDKCRPFIFMGVVSMTNYMIFGELELLKHQINSVVEGIRKIKYQNQ